VRHEKRWWKDKKIFTKESGPNFWNLFPEKGGCLLDALLPDTVGQRVVEAVFPPQRISGKKFQKIGLASST
jgi:hypothetical protein